MVDLGAIEARAAAAAPGPWRPVRCGIWSDTLTVVSDCADAGWTWCRAHQAFIAHARTDIPALVARVRELEADLVEERDRCARLCERAESLAHKLVAAVIGAPRGFTVSCPCTSTDPVECCAPGPRGPDEVYCDCSCHEVRP